MKETFSQYVLNLYHNVPTEVYEGLLAIFCIGSVLVIAICGWDKGWRKASGLLLAEYVCLIFCSTVICRTASKSAGHNFSPFWSYKAIDNGLSELIAENVMNVLVFLPVGLLAEMAFRNTSWWKVLILGCLVSITIETLQYELKCGFAETDDVMHNTLGCMIGYCLVKGARFMIHGFRRILINS